MRGAVSLAVVAAIATVVGVAVAARSPDRSACGRVGDREHAVAPGGARTAFVRCTASGSAWLYVADTRSERRLVPASYGCCYRPSASVVFREPAWSPDGRTLAVVVEDVGGTDVWTVRADGGAAARVTNGPARERAPRWTAGGRRIEFRTETGQRASVGATRP
jgi:Tol biopolymer transport system component